MPDMIGLLALPSEILEKVFTQCQPPDLAAIAGSCHLLNACVAKNRLLYKALYLKHYDEPPAKNFEHELDWEEELHNAVRLQKLLESRRADVKRENFSSIALAVQRLIDTAAIPSNNDRRVRSRNIAFLVEAFRSRINVDNLLCRSSLFERGGYTGRRRSEETDPDVRQLSAKLHVLYSMPARVELPRGKPLHAYARANVYDLRNYTDQSFWGPFMNDGSANVDWEKVESIMVDLGYNLKRFHEKTEGRFPLLWHTPFAGVSRNSFLSPQRKAPREEPLSELEAADPYNITGTWMRVVCFLDYSDLHAYNFASPPIPASQPRKPLEIEEAIRMITMKLSVTKVEPPSEDQGQSLPVVHFTGASRSMHAGWDPNANSSIRGTVSMTKHGEVRWTTFSVFYGEERWRSDGIQIGGLRSARGVWGLWGDSSFDPEGPVGGTAFWKLTDELPVQNSTSNTAVSMAASTLQAQHQAALSHSAAEYSQNLNQDGIGSFVHHSREGRDASRSVHLHPYMQSIDNDDEDGNADVAGIATDLEVGGAGQID